MKTSKQKDKFLENLEINTGFVEISNSRDLTKILPSNCWFIYGKSLERILYQRNHNLLARQDTDTLTRGYI